jgi:hypothetical protein
MSGREDGRRREARWREADPDCDGHRREDQTSRRRQQLAALEHEAEWTMLRRVSRCSRVRGGVAAWRIDAVDRMVSRSHSRRLRQRHMDSSRHGLHQQSQKRELGRPSAQP